MLGAPWAYPQPSDPSFENCRSCRKPPHRWPCPSQGSQHPMTALLGNIKARLPQRAFKDLRDDGLPPAPPRGSSLCCSWAPLQPNPGPAQGHAPHSWSRPLFLIELLEESSPQQSITVIMSLLISNPRGACGEPSPQDSQAAAGTCHKRQVSLFSAWHPVPFPLAKE